MTKCKADIAFFVSFLSKVPSEGASEVSDMQLGVSACWSFSSLLHVRQSPTLVILPWLVCVVFVGFALRKAERPEDMTD